MSAALLTVALMVPLLAGCASQLAVSVGAHGFSPHARLEPGSAVTVILHTWRHPHQQFPFGGGDRYSRSKEQKFAGCVAAAMKDTDPTIRVVPPEEFRRAALPDIAPKALPTSSHLPLDDPGFRERVRTLNVRYLIGLKGSTDIDPKGFGANAFLIDFTDRSSLVHATVIDLETGSKAEISASASGKDHLLFILFPVLVYKAYTETRICKELGVAISSYFQGGTRAVGTPRIYTD